MPLNVLGGPLEFSATIADNQFDSTIRRMESQLRGLTTTATKEASAIDSLVRKTTAAIAAYATFTAGANFIQNIVKVRGEMQALEVAFTTMLGSKQKSDQLLQEITEFAATTPFELKDVAGATKQLLAFGIAAGDIKSTLRSLGDVSAGIGAPLGEIAYLFGTIKTQGVALTQDVRQFAQRGIPIYDELSKVLGVSVEKVGDLITAGKVGFPEIQKVFQGLTAEGSKFGGLMEAQSKTLVGLQSNLRDSIDQMFNELGKSTEGIFAGIIRGATNLVQNYEKVIDVLKVIAATYGAYRAALILTNIVEAVSVQRKVALYTTGRALTAAQALQTAATLTLTRVTKLLNLAMLANPYVAITTAVVGFVAALAFLGDRTTAQEKAQKQLNQANEKYNEDLGNLKSKTSELVAIIGNETSTRLAQVQAFNELKALYPQVLKEMDLMGFKTLAAEDAQKRFNEAIDKNSLEKLKTDSAAANAEVKKLELSLSEARKANGRTGDALQTVGENLAVAREKAALLNDEIKKVEQAAWEANTPPQEQIEHYEKIKEGLVKQREELEKNVLKIREMSGGAVTFKSIIENINLRGVNSQIDDLTAKIKTLSGAGLDPVKDKAFFTKQKADAQVEIDKLKVTDAEFNKKKATYVAIIRDADSQLEKYDTTIKRNTSSTAAHNKAQSELNNLLEQRKNLIKNLNDQVAETFQFGQSEDQKELDAINAKYEESILLVSELNKKIEDHNKKFPNKKLDKIGLIDVNAFKEAHKDILNNTLSKQQTEVFKKSLDEQLQMYERFEQAKKEVGLEKAKELFKAQGVDYNNLLQLLQQQAQFLVPKIQFGIADDGDVEKFKALMAAIKSITDKAVQDNIDKEKENFILLLDATNTFALKKAAVNKKYDDLEATLKKNSTISEFEERKKILDQGRKDELSDLDHQLARASTLYRKLNQDILLFTRERLKEEIKILKAKLKTDTTLTPQQKADIQNTINQYTGLLNETNKVAQDFTKIAAGLSTVSGAFGSLASSVGEVNAELGDALQQLSDMASIGADAASSVASFATGDIAGGVTSAVSAISKIIQGFVEAQKSRVKAIQDVADFQAQILAGERDHNALVRERQREEIKTHKLKLKGLQDEKKLLQEQKQIALNTYSELFAKLQSESFVSGKGTKKRQGSPLTGFLGMLSGTRTELTEQLKSLAGKSFEEIEKLFLSGQLTDNAKKLFEQLQAIKQEGFDIDRLMAENAQMMREAVTGTTSQGIVDSIAEGFKNGLKTASDFAGTFEDLMRNALIESLKFKYLEGPLNDFFKDFAEASESGGQLDSTEIGRLRDQFNSMIGNFNTQFQSMQQIAGLTTTSPGGAGNSLSGAIRGITEQQADLLAGQFGGLRLSAVEHLAVGRQQLTALNAIQINTSLSAQRLQTVLDKMIFYYEIRGVKVI